MTAKFFPAGISAGIFAAAAVLLLSTISYTACAAGREFSLKSPDGRLGVTVTESDAITWTLTRDGKTLIAPSGISMTLTDGTVYGTGGKNCTVSNVKEDDNNGMILRYKGYSLEFRLFDNGVAYRFVSDRKGAFEVASEQAEFAFPEDWNAFVGYARPAGASLAAQFCNAYESHYEHIPLSSLEAGRLAYLPLLVEASDGVKLCITETALYDYPGLYLVNNDGSTTLSGVNPPYPTETARGGYHMLEDRVRGREDYIAKYDDGAPAFPWRIVAVASEAKDLLANDLPYRLAPEPAAGSDFSWVRPGKVSWEWWNGWNIKGVPFKSGINNDTYKYYIDFASANGIEYILLDEGWSLNEPGDLMQVVPEIDIKELVDYGRERNVGVLLWAGYWSFNRDMENVCRHYSEIGVKGFKVDFMNRDDQQMVAFQRRAAETAAKYHLLLDFHGTFKPVGLHRTFPNVLNYEAVYGLENMKGNQNTDQVTHDVIIPFVRMYAGPMDYTQGAMRNATKENFRAVETEPMSQGTRCRQLAEYVVFDSPLNMLCDSPTNYMAEPECLGFIAAVPTVWDETVPLAGEVGQYVAVAKRSGDTWYVGAMTDWNERDVSIDLSFLGDGSWEGEIFCDGVNADRAASDYRRDEVAFSADGVASFGFTQHLAPGGGFAAVLRKQ